MYWAGLIGTHRSPVRVGVAPPGARTVEPSGVLRSPAVVVVVYNLGSWLANYDQRVYVYKAWTRYFVTWASVIDQLGHHPRYKVTHERCLTIIDLRTAAASVG